jgi:nicotinate phosphoribosyltransferase
VAAARVWAERFADEMNVTVLVDFENDSVRTALEVADALGDKLWGVRLDTSELMVDRALWPDMGDFQPTGVNPRLVAKVREALNAEGFGHVRVICSGGFTAERIQAFEAAGVPVDSYGVGSSLLKGTADYTADVVLREGRPCAKVGRRFRGSARLRPVDLTEHDGRRPA